MSTLVAVLSITGALCLGAMSPGPSFVLVARTSVGVSRRDGMATALGMGVGGVVFSGLALAGLYTVLAMVSWLYAALKMGGGLYLLYLASKIWRGARKPLAFDQGGPAQKANTKPAFWVGLATQLSNPKTAIVYGSVFVSLLPRHPPTWCYVALPAIVFTIGVFGIFMNRKNVIVMLMSIELILLAVNINFVAFSSYLGDLVGQVFALFVLTVAAAEAAIGLAILVVYFRNRGTIAVEDVNLMKG